MIHGISTKGTDAWINCVCVKRITLCNCLCSSSSPSSSSHFPTSLIQNIEEFGAKNCFTDHRTANTVHGLRDSVPIQAPSNTRWFTVCWCKQHSSSSFQTCLYCLCLLKLYDKSIVILLTNDLTNVCSEISKIRLILWIVYRYLQCERVGGSWKVG